jgi:DNA-binding transcriptional ArsR family regulator
MSKRTSAVFAALGDPTRYRLVTRLARGTSLSIHELCVGTRVTRQAVTKHLAILERAALVKSERRGRERYFRLHHASLHDARTALGTMIASRA